MYRCFMVLCGLSLVLAASAETIIIAAEDDWIPYSSIKADKSGPEGLAPELITKIFKLKGVDVEFITLPFSRCMYYALIGKTVGCFDASITKENKDQYYWHNPPMFSEGLSIFTRTDSTENHAQIKDMEGKMVGYTIGYTYAPEIMQNKKIRFFGATSDHQQLNMLAKGRIQYAIINTIPGIRIINHDPLLKGKIKIAGNISEDSFWLAFSKTHPDGKRMMELFESGFTMLRSSGEYDKMMNEFRKVNGVK